MIRSRGLAELVAIALALAPTATAQEYSFRFYGVAEGLQNLVVLSLAQDHSGYIWAGTEGGLYRYDGTRFLLMGQLEGLPCSTEVHGLFVATDGALWANTCDRIFRFDGQRFLAIPGLNKLLPGAQVMADGTNGGVLITAPTGLFEASRGADGSFSIHSRPLPAAAAGKPMHGILRSGARVWFGCGQQLCAEEAGQVSVFGKENGLPEDSWDGIQISPDGSVWVRSPKSVYRRGPGQLRFVQEKPDIASSGFWGALIIRQDGSVMVPTDQGLAIHTNAGWSVIDRHRGLHKENTAAVLEDRDGSVWIGLAGGGMARWLGGGMWESWTRDQGLPADIVWGILRDRRGTLWIGSSMGLTRIEASGRTTTCTRKDGLGGDNVRWLAETSDGSIWAVMKPGGLARIDPISGRIHITTREEGLPCDPEDLYVDRQNRLWLPTACGLFVNERPSESNRVTRVATPESFGRAAWKLIEDAQGVIWVSNGAVLWSLQNGRWRPHSRSDGLLTDSPYVMALAPDGSIWLRHRYDAGIDRVEIAGDRIVRATVIVPAEPKTAEGTAFHGFDAFGNFWRGSTNGASVLHGKVWTKFTAEDGLVSNDCDGEAFWADKDGDVWVGTSAGLAHYHSKGPAPPAPLVAHPTITRLEINQASRLIRAEFTSLDYKAEQLVRFAYRLDQGPWTDSVERSVSISGLGPGSHWLQVRCRIREGPFSSTVATSEFRLEPKWEETWWARLLAIAFSLFAIMQFVRWRLSAAARKQAELEATVATRTATLSEANRSLDDKASQLRTSEGRLKNAERLAHLGHWDLDPRSDQLSWSEEMFRIFGVAQDYALTYPAFMQAVIPQHRERLERWVNECFTKKSGRSIEIQVTRPNGDLRTLSLNSEVLLDDAGQPLRLFGACQDITESRRAQQEDFVRKKLESVGRLAGGVAHDFNNLLGAALAQAELALVKSASGANTREELTSIVNVAIRGSEIVRQLMIYAGKESDVPGLVDISRTIAEMIDLLKVLASKRATVITNLGENLPAVWASAAQIRQIVLNLVTNASEAIGDREGRIIITTSCVTPDRDTIITKDLAPGDYLQLKVSDTGCGMSQEIQAKAFDPFFTTKSNGHGLGLAVVHGIVRGLRGAIQIVSQAGRGTTFQVLLPCAESLPEAAGKLSPASRETERLSREFNILVVEDEGPLRQAVVKILRKNGFAVLEAADGTVAIDLLRANVGKIDVILLDMTIPGAPSHEVVAEAEARPEIKVVLTSAYSREMMTSPLNASRIHGFIRKPYRLVELAQILRDAASS